MAEVVKIYQSDKLHLSVTLIVDGKSDAVNFDNGIFSTSNVKEQEAIEGCELFRSGHVRIAAPAPSPREALVAKVKAANAESATANAALNDFDKANAAPAA